MEYGKEKINKAARGNRTCQERSLNFRQHSQGTLHRKYLHKAEGAANTEMLKWDYAWNVQKFKKATVVEEDLARRRSAEK